MSRDAGLPRRRWLGAGGGLALIAAVWPAGARAAAILAVRVWPARDYTRVTLESDGALLARHQLVDQPPRLVIDLDAMQLDSALRELVGQVRPDDPFIAGVRVGQYQPQVVRLVLDLKQAVRPEQFALDPVAAYRHRLVFDLYPLSERDPLAELIQEIDKAGSVRGATATPPKSASGAAASSADRLGEFIGRLPPTPAPSAPPSAPGHHMPAGSPGAPVASAPAAVATSPAAGHGHMERLAIVALDPGHGGEDPGAIGPSGLREKDVVLAIALLLRERLNARPGLRAMLTRDADFFVPLHERVRRARRVGADLFVSIHADAFITPAARGASVFVLSEGGATSTAARWLADKENAADLVGGVNVAVRDNQVLRVLLDMSTTAQIQDSLRVGAEVLGRIGRVGRLHKPRVEQAGFAVLKAPDIPSILVETAFISNPQEEALLADPAWRERLADALAEGIARWFERRPPRARQRPT